ncbi:MAG: AbrB/MazE/SpoVT family DNA-binding domain-containing protein [Bacilli bacterium]
MTERLHMAVGTPVEVVERDNEIVIRRKQYSLEELLDQVTVENTHSETDWGKPTGREMW